LRTALTFLASGGARAAASHGGDAAAHGFFNALRVNEMAQHFSVSASSHHHPFNVIKKYSYWRLFHKG